MKGLRLGFFEFHALDEVGLVRAGGIDRRGVVGRGGRLGPRDSDVDTTKEGTEDAHGELQSSVVSLTCLSRTQGAGSMPRLGTNVVTADLSASNSVGCDSSHFVYGRLDREELAKSEGGCQWIEGEAV